MSKLYFFSFTIFVKALLLTCTFQQHCRASGATVLFNHALIQRMPSAPLPWHRCCRIYILNIRTALEGQSLASNRDEDTWGLRLLVASHVSNHAYGYSF